MYVTYFSNLEHFKSWQSHTNYQNQLKLHILKKILTLKKKKKPDELNPENPEHTVVVLRNIRHLACRTFVPETGGLRCLVDNFVHLQIKVYYQHFRNVRNTKHTQDNYMFIGMNQSV